MAPVPRWLKTEVLETPAVNKVPAGFPRTLITCILFSDLASALPQFRQGQVNPLKAEARLGLGQQLTPVMAEPEGGQSNR